MANPAPSVPDRAALEARCADALAGAERALVGARPIVRHLLGNPDPALFSERIVAQTGALLHDLACQLVDEFEGPVERCGRAERCEALAAALADHAALLGHLHALAFEAQAAEALEARMALDQVVSPLLRTMVASPDPQVSRDASALVAAQARFGQAQRRGEWPLDELPGDLLQAALMTLRAWADPARDAEATAAERAIRKRFDDNGGRLALLGRLIAAMGDEAVAALDIAQAGVALFVTALATATRMDRDVAVLALAEGQLPRLALGLTACGLGPTAVEAQCLALHPDAVMPAGIESLDAAAAAALLDGAQR